MSDPEAESLPSRLAAALAQILLVLWLGGMWAIGYMATPVLFASLDDRMLAGNIAGRLFTLMAWIGLGAALYLLGFMLARQGRAVLRRAPFWIVATMLVCVSVGYFGLQAEMAALKADVATMDVMESAMREKFAMLHGISSAIYLAQSVLGLWLVAGMCGLFHNKP